MAVVGYGVGYAAQLSEIERRDDREDERQLAGVAAGFAAPQFELQDAERDARLASLAATTLAELDPRAADSLARVLIVGTDGVLLADAHRDEQAVGGVPPGGERWLDRPELRDALRGRWVQLRRYSRQLAATIELTAGPIFGAGGPIAAIRVSHAPASSAAEPSTARALRDSAAVGAVVLAFGLLATSLLARHLTRPLRRLAGAAHEIRGGNLKVAAPLEGSREHHEVARAFNEMISRLVSLLRSQEQFAGDASHQLRTPLTAVSLQLELIKRVVEDNPDAVDAADVALEEIGRLDAVVKRLLKLSRAPGGAAGDGTADLHVAVTKLVRRRARLAERRGVELVVDAAPRYAPVWCSPADLEQILDILLDNALHYARSRVTLTVDARVAEIADDGPGLSAEDERRVFERFYRGSASAADPDGTGLGLALALKLAEHWEAELSLTNRPDGIGACARLALRPSTFLSAP